MKAHSIEDFYVVKVFQVKLDLLKRFADEASHSKGMAKYLMSLHSDDTIQLIPSHYERTNTFYVQHEVDGKIMEDYDVLSFVYRELNVGKSRNNHKSYSLSVNDVISIDGRCYRVCSMGFARMLNVKDKDFEPAETALTSKYPQLSNETTELRSHQDIEFDVFVFQNDDGDLTFLEDLLGGSWDDSELDQPTRKSGRMYPKNTNVSPFHLTQRDFYMITHIDEHGVHHAYDNLRASDVEEWLSIPEYKIAYKDGFASIYLQDKYLSLSAYKAFIELH